MGEEVVEKTAMGFLKKAEQQIIGTILTLAVAVITSAVVFYFTTQDVLANHSRSISENKSSIQKVGDKTQELSEKVYKLEDVPMYTDQRLERLEKSVDELRQAQAKEAEQNQKIYQILIELNGKK